MAKPLQKCLEFLYEKFSNNPAGMIIVTSVTGWALSALAQIIAIAVNPKIKEEQKVFLIPQEFNDALVNIGAFLFITQVTKKTVTNLFKTGKFAPSSVRKYLNENVKSSCEKIGKLDINLDEVLKNSDEKTLRAYNTYKNFGVTTATIGASILSANIVTPIIRNKMASRVQKSYININSKQETEKPEVPQPEVQTLNNIGKEQIDEPAKQPLQSVHINTGNNGSMRV